MQHFPEERWRRTKGYLGAYLTIALIFSVIFGAFGLFFLFQVPGVLNKLIIAGPGIWLAVSLPWSVWSHRKDEIILTADGIKGPGWKRTLHFADVEKIELKGVFNRYKGKTTAFQMKFIFKKRLSPQTQWSLRSSCRSIWLFLPTGMSEKPEVMLKTISSYYNRQKEA